MREIMGGYTVGGAGGDAGDRNTNTNTVAIQTGASYFSPESTGESVQSDV